MYPLAIKGGNGKSPQWLSFKSPKSSMEHPQALIKDDRLIAGKIIEKSKER
jgi:hypothetical protein